MLRPSHFDRVRGLSGGRRARDQIAEQGGDPENLAGRVTYYSCVLAEKKFMRELESGFAPCASAALRWRLR